MSEEKCHHSDDFYCPNCSPVMKHAKITDPMSLILEAQKNGYDFGFNRGFAEAVRLLRSEEAPRDASSFYPYNNFWADWLEEQRSKE